MLMHKADTRTGLLWSTKYSCLNVVKSKENIAWVVPKVYFAKIYIKIWMPGNKQLSKMQKSKFSVPLQGLISSICIRLSARNCKNNSL